MLLQLGSKESLSLCQPSLPRSCLSLKFLHWVKNKRQQTFIFSVVMLIKGHVLCPPSVSWHPPAPPSHCPLAQSWRLQDPIPLWQAHVDGAPSTWCYPVPGT